MPDDKTKGLEMFQLTFIFLALLLLLILSYLSSYCSVILTPQFGFVSGFLLSVSFAFCWIKEWELSLCDETVYVLVFGNILFVLVSFITQKIALRYKLVLGKKDYNHREKYSAAESKIQVEEWKLYLFLSLQCLILLITLYYLIFKIGGGLLGAIYIINSSSKKEEVSVGFPFVIRQLRNLSFASSFIWSYMLVHACINKYKNHTVLLAVNLLLSVLIYLLGGARQGLIQVIVAIVVYGYFIWGEGIKWGKRLRIETILKVIAVGLILILSYQNLGNLFGRNFNINSNDYIGAYLSAEIKNLDIFIRKGEFGQGNSFSTTQTFAHITNQLAGRFGFPERAFKFDQPYNYVNGHYLGNVYTVFWAFLYDGGYIAFIVLTAFMAFILQLIYIRVMKNRSRINEEINVALIVYGYMYFECAFSFFTAWFFARTFNTSFLYYIIYWFLLKVYIEKVKLGKKKGT